VWLSVLIVGSFATLLGTVAPNFITVRRPHNFVRLLNEALAGQHLTYVGFFPALPAAHDLTELCKNLCLAGMLSSIVFLC
jgi:hypothetical protein